MISSLHFSLVRSSVLWFSYRRCPAALSAPFLTPESVALSMLSASSYFNNEGRGGKSVCTFLYKINGSRCYLIMKSRLRYFFPAYLHEMGADYFPAAVLPAQRLVKPFITGPPQVLALSPHRGLFRSAASWIPSHYAQVKELIYACRVRGFTCLTLDQ